MSFTSGAGLRFGAFLHSSSVPTRAKADSRVTITVIVVMPCGFDLDLNEAGSGATAGVPRLERLVGGEKRPGSTRSTAMCFNRAGPRIVDSAELLARLIHPELFAADADTSINRYWSPLF